VTHQVYVEAKSKRASSKVYIPLANPAVLEYITSYPREPGLIFDLIRLRVMDTNRLHKEFLSEGSAGYAVIRKFYSRYADVLAHSTIVSIDDVVNEVFVSIAKTDFTKVQNAEHYILRAIKLHCWSMLDKALRMKSVSAQRKEDAHDEDEDPIVLEPSTQHQQLAEVEGMELLGYINLFKSTLGTQEAQLLNMLIDGVERFEIAKKLVVNINTLDTHIRRLRIRLADYLRSLGYSYAALEKFE